MNSIRKNNKNFLNKPVEKWKVKNLTAVINNNNGSPHSPVINKIIVVIVGPLVTIVCLKNKLTCKLKN